LPTGPVRDQSVAQLLRLIFGQSAPDLVRLKEVRSRPIAVIPFPVVSRRIPDGEPAIHLRINDESRDGRAAALHGPCLALSVERARRVMVRTGALRIGVLARRVGGRRVTEEHASSPGSRQCPPRLVQEKALPPPIVTRKEVDSTPEVDLHAGCRPDIFETKPPEHGAARP